MASLIKEFGFKVPVVARSDGSVVDGHLRLMAARHLGMETVPVVLADEWTDAQVKAFRIAVNKSAELAEWDTSLLALEIEDLKELDFDLELTGFELPEIDELLGDVKPLEEYPKLPEGDRQSLAEMTFTLTIEQVETVNEAVKQAKKLAGGVFEGTGNENGNGNALAFICEDYLGRLG
jgi:ParB-like chromosome segregation protein Spo0J